MRYDFTKVQKLMEERALTPADLAKMTNDQLDKETIRKALKRSTAHPRTAKVMTEALCISMKDVLPKKNGTRESAA